MDPMRSQVLHRIVRGLADESLFDLEVNTIWIDLHVNVFSIPVPAAA